MERDEEPTEMTAMTGELEFSAPVVMTTPDDEQHEGISTPWNTFTSFVRKTIKTPRGLCLQVTLTVLSFLFLLYLMAKVGIGAFHIGECPLEPFVPIYVVLSGGLLLVFFVVLLVVSLRCVSRSEEDEGVEEKVSPIHLVVLLYFFIHIVLQLAGSVCIIRARDEVIAQHRLEASSKVTESSVSLIQHTVELIAPEVTPAYPLMEPVLRVAPVISPSHRPALPECNAAFMEFAFGTVIFELLLSGLFFIFVVVSLCELTYIVCFEPSLDSPKKVKVGNRDNRILCV